jgi:asparagine synthase (glutamine-hydrolysing)
MCGIAGVLYADPTRPVDPFVLHAMGDAIAHRGPDGEGYWTEAGIGLVHRRLSIIDLAGGAQPLGNEDGTIQAVFNGEIYNYQALRADLKAKGHRFQTASDTEVLVHLYEEAGERLVERLRGMFAFALWDSRRKHLFLARDRLGIKPLYIYRDADTLLFASELKSILADPAVRLQVDPAGVEDYLTFGMIPGRRCIYTQIEKLPAAHTLLVRPEALDCLPRRYWQLSLEADGCRSLDEWQEAVPAKVAEAVRLHLIADVPIGAFLSGGLDSSVIVGEAKRASPQSLQTFSMGFREESFSELPYAREVANRFGTDHRVEVVTPDAVELLDELAHHYDEPFADPSAIPTYLVSRLAARHVKVALSGDGGDEAFAGYARYSHDLAEARMRGWLPAWLRRVLLSRLAYLWPKADWLPRPLRAKTLLTNLSLEPGDAYANTLSCCRKPLRRQLLAPHLARALSGYEPEEGIRKAYRTAPSNDPLAGMLAADVAVLLPDDFLVKVDRASMAHGLEVRPPLLDHELLELVARVPSEWKIRGGQTKWLFKWVYQHALPADIVWRAKHGFEIPVDSWLRYSLRNMFESCVLDSNAVIGQLINQPYARKLYGAHVAGTARHGNVLWSLLVLARWAERYLTCRAKTVRAECVSP